MSRHPERMINMAKGDIQGVVVDRDEAGNITQLSGGSRSVPGVPETSARLTGKQIREMLAGGFNPTAPTPAPLTRPNLGTVRQVPPRGGPPRESTARRQAETDKANVAQRQAIIGRIEAENVVRVEEGKKPKEVPPPLAPTPIVHPDKTIPGIPRLGTEPPSPPAHVAPPRSTQLPTVNVVSDTEQPSPPAPRSDTVLSGGDPVPGFPWIVGSPASQPGVSPLPWREIARSQEDFVPGFPETVTPVVAPRNDLLEVQVPGDEPPIDQTVAPNPPQIRPAPKIQTGTGGGKVPVPDFPWSVGTAKEGEGPRGIAFGSAAAAGSSAPPAEEAEEDDDDDERRGKQHHRAVQEGDTDLNNLEKAEEDFMNSPQRQETDRERAFKAGEGSKEWEFYEIDYGVSPDVDLGIKTMEELRDEKAQEEKNKALDAAFGAAVDFFKENLPSPLEPPIVVAPPGGTPDVKPPIDVKPPSLPPSPLPSGSEEGAPKTDTPSPLPGGVNESGSQPLPWRSRPGPSGK